MVADVDIIWFANETRNVKPQLTETQSNKPKHNQSL